MCTSELNVRPLEERAPILACISPLHLCKPANWHAGSINQLNERGTFERSNLTHSQMPQPHFETKINNIEHSWTWFSIVIFPWTYNQNQHWKHCLLKHLFLESKNTVYKTLSKGTFLFHIFHLISYKSVFWLVARFFVCFKSELYSGRKATPLPANLKTFKLWLLWYNSQILDGFEMATSVLWKLAYTQNYNNTLFCLISQKLKKLIIGIMWNKQSYSTLWAVLQYFHSAMQKHEELHNYPQSHDLGCHIMCL